MATLKNTTINDTGFLRLPPGNTAQRPASPLVGMIRYNIDLGFTEQYNQDGWQGIAPPPVITSISPTTFNGEGGTNITVNGSNFDTSAFVTFVLNGGAVVNATTTTRNSSAQLVGTVPRDFLASESPATIRVTNGSGLTANAENALTFADVPIFTTAAGSLGTIFDSSRTSYSLSTASATDVGGTITYSITSGAVPAGMSFNTTTAAITGTPNAVGSDTTSTFTVRALDNAGNTTDRTFTITVRAPVVQSFTTVGTTSFSVPTGLTAVDVLIVAGAGAGGLGFTPLHETGGGGGAGGLIFRPAMPVTPGGSVSVTVGSGGAGMPGQPFSAGQQTTRAGNGNNSSFSSLTAIGGGSGGNPYQVGAAGGSGGGASPANPLGDNAGGGAAQQPSQPGDSGTFGFGNVGGGARNGSGNNQTAGGGGGAGGSGARGQPGSGGPGGAGRTYSITGSPVGYAGGGSGGGSCSGSLPPGSASSGGGSNASPGTTNRGGGGGGARQQQAGGNGGSGVVIVRY